VASLPAMPAAPELATAKAAMQQAAAAVQRAESVAEHRDQALRELDRALATVTAHQDQARVRLGEITTRLANAPDPQAARTGLGAIEQAQADVQAAGAAVRATRTAQRSTDAAQRAAQDRHAQAWRGFDVVRDRLTQLGPPPADRDDLPGSWVALQAWAGEQVADRLLRRGAAADQLAQLTAEAEQQAGQIWAMLQGAGLSAPVGTDPARYAAVAAERARGVLTAVKMRRELVATLAQQRAEYETTGQAARSLANHLRANNFERWLLEEALDLLVAGASRTLRELSGGQYELVHASGEFFVVDHYDAALRRSVRTLSGGETFQASLALALALSEQLSGVSTRRASLESIVLDEGFGTLDAASLETVAVTLENLAAQGDRMVGVVTHVNGLADRIPVRFEVSKDMRTARVERVGV
jgi:exonuclease SbcC